VQTLKLLVQTLKTLMQTLKLLVQTLKTLVQKSASHYFSTAFRGNKLLNLVNKTKYYKV
jgi:hypothetical protein